jgi:FkbM family methyltransferase
VTLPETIPHGVSTVTVHGVTFGMWTSPDKIGRMFSEGNIYELPLLEWIREQKFSGTAIDVGANIGNHTLWMAAVCGLRVEAFEPVLPHVINANVQLNRLRNQVTVYPVGLGSVAGEYHHVSKGVLKVGKSDQTTDERVTVGVLDAYAFHNVALIKIDVEGMEVDVLAGGMFTIGREKPVVVTEEWSKQTTRRIAALLGPLGYTRKHGFGGRGRAPMGIWMAS